MGAQGSVTIGSNTYAVYGSFAAAVAYFPVAIDAASTAWLGAATDTIRMGALLASSRMLDRAGWQGTPVTPPKPDVQLQWPRANVVDALGNTVDPTSIPDTICEAAYVLAGLILSNSATTDSALSGSNVKSVSAKSGTSVEFFRPTIGVTGKYPTQVNDLIGQYLAGAVTDASGVGSASGIIDDDGNPVQSEFDDSDAYDLNRSI